MIKIILIGIWISGIALGSSYFSATFMAVDQASTGGTSADGPIEFVKSDMISVPVIRKGKVQGYIVAQFTFALYTNEIAKLKFIPNPFLFDAAFRCLYEDTDTDFTKLKQQDMTQLVKRVIERVGEKIGSAVTKDVLLNEINYVARDDVRTNWVKKEN